MKRAMLLSITTCLLSLGYLNGAHGFAVVSQSLRIQHPPQQRQRQLSMALGDFTVELEKPLGIVLEECEAGSASGVQIASLVKDGTAANSGQVASGEVLLAIQDTDVSTSGFDSVMDLLVEAESPVTLTMSDGLGRMDIANNLLKRLTPQQAMLTDSVVRAAVKAVRKSQRLGDLLRVEIIIGSGFRDDDTKCLVRFFAIFSTDGGVTTYSCNVSATGVVMEDGSIDVVALSCAKDEGLGQTIDLIVEDA